MRGNVCPPVLPIALCVLLGFLPSRGPAWGQVFEVPPSPADRTSAFFTEVICYDATNSVQIACAFTHEILGVREPITDPGNNGGHQHFSPPHVVLNDIFDPKTGACVSCPQLDCLFCTDVNGDRTIVRSFTNPGISPTPATVLHPLPQVAGKIETRTIIDLPPRFRCRSGCEPSLATLDVGLRDLQELVAQDSDNFVFKPREGDPHPAAHHGTLKLHTGIRILSTAYKDITRGSKPVITDMSLPEGGMFDLNLKWFVNGDETKGPLAGHVSHRDGHDVDISARDTANQSIECFREKDQKMKDALRRARDDFRYCDADDGHYHVRFKPVP